MTVLKYAQHLIQQPSLTPQDAGCQDYLAQQLAPLGFHIEHYNQKDTSNMLATWGQGPISVLFVGHTDVVPPGNIDQWCAPPFDGQIIDGHLIGRGAVDMKGAIAAMLSAQQRCIHDGLQGALAWLITSDEEGVGTHGIQAVIPQLLAQGYHFNHAIVGEPASVDRIGDTLKIGRRGSLHLALMVKGSMGHVAYPDAACNPNPILVAALNTLLNHTWDLHDPSPFPNTSLQITALAADGGAENVIPDQAHARLNFRFPPTTCEQTLIETTERLLAPFASNIHCDWRLSAKPYYSKADSLVEICQQVLQKHGIDKVKISTGGGTSDGRFLAPLCDQIVEMGAQHGKAHQCNESIAVEALMQLEQMYYDVLMAVFT